MTTEVLLNRAQVVQRLLDLFERPRYLEIGVQDGSTFHAVTATAKTAVDPEFRFDWQAAQAADPSSTYFSMISDDFFFRAARECLCFDVVFLDGLHTVEQTLRDALNAIMLLSPSGIILIDDVRPSSYEASVPDLDDFYMLRKFTGLKSLAWMGDVFKLLYFFDTFLQGYTYRTVADNHGQAVLWRSPRGKVRERTLSEVADKTFRDFVLEQDILKMVPLEEIILQLKGRTSEHRS